ncbi:MAG: hypothetical protein K2X49_14755 [Acetobacteraceae bacterium]|nr:hypothetical protein [Acetobacteraceae bacterium]
MSRHARPGAKLATPWLLALLARKPKRLAAVALAMMTRGEAYRPPAATGTLPAAA